jgi:hypothetical protein
VLRTTAGHDWAHKTKSIYRRYGIVDQAMLEDLVQASLINST